MVYSRAELFLSGWLFSRQVNNDVLMFMSSESGVLGSCTDQIFSRCFAVLLTIFLPIFRDGEERGQ